LAIIALGMGIGALAQFVVGRSGPGGRVNWPLAFAAGLIGSFVGGLLFSLLAGDGLSIRPSGIIGTFIGAIIVSLGWQLWDRRRA
jgi:uncharacterized membrane protein YeaQ/YmgE (transglycosylase-associated protein family)